MNVYNTRVLFFINFPTNLVHRKYYHDITYLFLKPEVPNFQNHQFGI